MTVQELERRLAGRTPGLQGVGREYAVLVPVIPLEGGLHLLFEVRADTLASQPGEVCFPGGGIEPGESVEECALRETWEELRIPACAIHPLARLDAIYHQGGFLMHPVLAGVEAGALADMRPSAAEVKETFLVPLDFFRTNAPTRYGYDLIPDVKEDFPYEAVGSPKGYPWKKGRVDVPVYLWEGRAVWGLTGRVIQNLIGLLE